MKRLLVGAFSLILVSAGFIWVIQHREYVTIFSASPDTAIVASATSSDSNTPSPASSTLPFPAYPAEVNRVQTPVGVRAVYLTACTAGISKRRQEIIALAEQKGLNAVVIDVKDSSGFVAYKMPQVPGVQAAKADARPCAGNIQKVLQDFHSAGIYVIARIAVFEDPVFAKANPGLAVKNASSGIIWEDNHGLAWLDPAAEDNWKYIESIAKDAWAQGFDEINFDYIRFPTDGKTSVIGYPVYKPAESKTKVIDRFFSDLRESLKDEIISADIFGFTATASDDLGIGQTMETVFPYFNYVCPMVYPSHFSPGNYGFKEPAAQPYAMVNYSMRDAQLKRDVFLKNNPGVPAAEFRPWLQAFDLLGVKYDNAKIQEEVKGLNDAFSSSTEILNGWMFWDPWNLYSNI